MPWTNCHALVQGDVPVAKDRQAPTRVQGQHFGRAMLARRAGKPLRFVPDALLFQSDERSLHEGGTGEAIDEGLDVGHAHGDLARYPKRVAVASPGDVSPPVRVGPARSGPAEGLSNDLIGARRRGIAFLRRLVIVG